MVKVTVLSSLSIVRGGGQRSSLRQTVTQWLGLWTHVDRLRAPPERVRINSHRRIVGNLEDGFSSINTTEATTSLNKYRLEEGGGERVKRHREQSGRTIQIPEQPPPPPKSQPDNEL